MSDLTLTEAKRLVREKWGRLPRPGWQMLAGTYPIAEVDPGYHNWWLRETNRTQKWFPKITRVSYWLGNNAGDFYIHEQYHHD